MSEAKAIKRAAVQVAALAAADNCLLDCLTDWLID